MAEQFKEQGGVAPEDVVSAQFGGALARLGRQFRVFVKGKGVVAQHQIHPVAVCVLEPLEGEMLNTTVGALEIGVFYEC